jgi:hypothetical protein
MKLDLDYRVVQDLKFDKPEVFDCERRAVVIRVGIAQRCKKLDAILKHPLSLGRHQHRQAFHEVLATIGLKTGTIFLQFPMLFCGG